MNEEQNNENDELKDFDDKFSSEEEVIEIPQEIRKINTQAYDKSVSDLYRMMSDGDINLNPEYQRNYIWQNPLALLGSSGPQITHSHSWDCQFKSIALLQFSAPIHNTILLFREQERFSQPLIL